MQSRHRPPGRGGFVRSGQPPTLPTVSVDAWDKWAIRAWHEGWHPAALDAVAPLWREKSTWIPLYAALLLWLLWRDRRWGLYNALAAGIAVGLSDHASAGIIKPIVGRIRPCNLPGLRYHLDLLTGCGAGESFPSAHAANHFALATVLCMTCFAERPLLRWLSLLWAASIAVGQVYVGRHYPTDVLAGGALGSLIGYLVGRVYLWLRTRYRRTSSAVAPSSPAAG